MALIFSGCESPTDGSSGASGLDGAVTLGGDSVDVDAAMLAAVFKVTDRILILPGTASVEGEIPAGKTLFVSGATAIGTSTSDTLEVIGTLEIFKGAELDASGLTSAGLLTGTGSVRGDGAIGLPYLNGNAPSGLSPITYTSSNVSVTGKYAASYSTGGAPAALDDTGLAAIFALDGVNALTVNDYTVTAASIPANKTLTLIGDDNTIAAGLDLTDKGTLVVAEGAELEATGLLKGSITNNGTITTTDTTADNVLSYITVPTGPGKVEIGGDVDLSAKTAAAALTQNVEVASSKKLTAPNIATPFSTTAGKTITVAEGGTLDLGATATGVGVPVNNDGTVTTATTSAAALNTILAIKGDIESSGAVIGNAAITVPADTALTIASSGSLAVAKDITLTVSGDATLAVEGTLNVAADAEVEVASGGVFTVENSGSGDLNGTITIKSGGVSYDLASVGGSLWATASAGKYVFESGAKAYIGGTTDGDLLIGGPTDDARVQLAAGATFSNSKTAYTLDGDATLNGTLLLEADTPLTIKAGKTLTIGKTSGTSVVLGLLVDTNKPAIKGEAGAKIVLVSDQGYIDIYDSSLTYQNDISALPHNFYSATGTKEIANSFQGTYAWDANAGGQDVAGWLKQAATPTP
jgi:hypothetical protein